MLLGCRRADLQFAKQPKVESAQLRKQVSVFGVGLRELWDLYLSSRRGFPWCGVVALGRVRDSGVTNTSTVSKRMWKTSSHFSHNCNVISGQ